MANLSSVIVQTVGTSVSGVNLITAPNESSIWTAATITKSTTTTAAELPLGPAIPTATKFALAASAGSAYCDFEVPASLLTSKLGLGWFARASSSFTATISLTLQSFSSTSNRTSGTSPTSVTLQTSTVQGTAPSFFTTFDGSGQQYYRLTISFTGLASAWYSVCQVQVGPGDRQQVSPIGEWQSFTPTGSWTANTTYTGYWKRDGSDMLLQYFLSLSGAPTATGLSLDLPVGYNLNPNATISAGLPVGDIRIRDAGVNSYTGLAILNATSGRTAVIGTEYHNNNTGVTATAPFSFGSGDNIAFMVRVPILEWAGGTLNVGQGAQVQYLYNTGSTTAAGGSDTSSFAYGPGGTAILSINSTTGTGNSQTTFRVRSQYPIQTGSQINVGISEDGNTWTTPDARGIGWVRQGPATFGIGWRRVSGSTTDIDVLFGNAGADPGSGTTYAPAGGGSAWSGFTSYKWRVTIVNPSSPVGFGMANSNDSGLIKPRNGQYSITVSGSVTLTSYRCIGVYYQDQDGNHRLKFNFAGTVGAGVRTGNTLTFSGVTFKNASGFNQAVTAISDSGIICRSYTNINSPTLVIDHASASSAFYGCSGDVELESKPSWA